MLRKVRLYGQLAKFVGKRVLEADIATAGEAVRFLIANWPELESHMADQYYRVTVGERDLGIDEVCYPAGTDEVRIIPVVGGAGNNTSRILLGAALITVAIIAPGAGWGAGGAVGFGSTAKAATAATFSATALAGNVGVALVLSGVAGLLTPTPSIPGYDDDPQVNSFTFSGIQQTARAGTAVPVCYGEVLTGSIVISAELDIEQIQA